MPRHLAFDVEHYSLLRHGLGVSAGSLTGIEEADRRARWLPMPFGCKRRSSCRNILRVIRRDSRHAADERLMRHECTTWQKKRRRYPPPPMGLLA